MEKEIAEILSKVVEKLDKIEDTQRVTSEKIDTIEAAQKVAFQKIDTIEAAQKETSLRLDGMEQDIRHTRMLFEDQNDKLQLLCDAQAETAAKFGQLDRMEQTLNEVKSEVKVIRDVVRFHSADIASLKKAR